VRKRGLFRNIFIPPVNPVTWLGFKKGKMFAIVQKRYKAAILPRDAMHSADYAVARCPSVCPSIRLFVRLSHAGIVSKRSNFV